MQRNRIPSQRAVKAVHRSRQTVTCTDKCALRLRKTVNFGLGPSRIFMRFLYSGGRSHLVSLWTTKPKAEIVDKAETSRNSDMATDANSHDRRARKLQEWLLLLLRFAVTHESSDQFMAYALADELDALGQQWRPAAPSFFRRTSTEICEAILAVSGGRNNNPVLRKRVQRIDNPRLKRAFCAAVGLDSISEPRQVAPEHFNALNRGQLRHRPL
jgi:hypothetical protein